LEDLEDDFSRAFASAREPKDAAKELVRCDRKLLEKIEGRWTQTR